jgi:hypothetical protein
MGRLEPVDPVVSPPYVRCRSGTQSVCTHSSCQRREEERVAGRFEVGRAVRDWAMRAEIQPDGEPIDWAWLGEIIRWSGASLGNDSEDSHA